MISKKEIKDLAKKHSKKLSKESFNVLEEKVATYISELIKSSSRKADFSGRILIKPEDFII
ncbi:hypothetical protein KAJ87_00260 [Candidatus Pacearchaeota archaeon]|nr:hypothetical protein [Candidatus Pacearchaeota archaeon]